MKDMVEIRPVLRDGDGFAPVFGDEAHAPDTISVDGPGNLQIRSNPHYAEGAYANLRYYQVRPSLEAADLSMEPGTAHRLTLDRAIELFPQFMLVADADGLPNYDRIDPMASAVQAAIDAGRAHGATHIEIRVA